MIIQNYCVSLHYRNKEIQTNKTNKTMKANSHLYSTNYKVAALWLNNSLVLCNNIAEVDPSIWENAEFETYNEETGEYAEIYQYFITDCSKSDKEYLQNTFGLLFTYSDLLDCYILCVDHCGTSWDYVHCDTTNPHAARELGESK